MLRSWLAFSLVVPCVLLLAGACGGSSSGGPSTSGPLDEDGGGGGGTGPAGLPCDVADVLAEHCQKCHASPPQFGAPMPLVTWDDLDAPSRADPTKKVYEGVIERVADERRRMPPSPNAPLSDAEQKTIADWIAAGAPRSTDQCGAPTDKPPPQGLSCTPDLSLEPASAWEMPEAAGDEYVCWGVDLSKEQATHVTAFAPVIDNTEITHHIVLYEAPSAYSRVPTRCNAGSAIAWRMVLGWAPGVGPLELPPEAGFPISTDPAKPTHYVAQMHYSNPTGKKGATDKSRIDLCTSAPRQHEADVMAFGSQSFEIPAAPPAGGRYTIDCALTAPAAFAGLHFFAAMPHMHQIGVAMSTTLTPAAGGPDVDLGSMSSFSFDSQAWLPVSATLKAGDVIRTSCSWTNNTGAPVRFGEKTGDEMCYSFSMYYPRIKSSLWSWAAPASGPPIGATCN
ncbi:MAG: peptidylglycine alpha-amidating monooxygenase [Labilithrix sp.]|nr:peptidylglycine alpha-amidating monooxygenase [Labilithrix sp.]